MSDSLLIQLRDLIAEWPDLSSGADMALVEDSLVLLDHLGDARRVADVGSGGGLPGLPLKIARPDLELVMIESNRRRAAFLVATTARLGLAGVTVVGLRAEDAGREPSLRETFDAVTVRALAPMAVLAELCLPLLRVGGRLLAMKVEAMAEVTAAGPAIRELGGRLLAVAAAPTAARSRGQVVVVAKVAPCPDRYPRRAGVPARRPLGIKRT
ncbi:MAG: 16S rRNA (guanine(527)-N(7))-methyltransferase RsmG [Candidatus Dormibacteraceae bacterium]